MGLVGGSVLFKKIKAIDKKLNYEEDCNTWRNHVAPFYTRF